MIDEVIELEKAECKIKAEFVCWALRRLGDWYHKSE